MAPAGTEEKVMLQLERAGSFGAQNIKASPLLRPGGPAIEESSDDDSLGDSKEEKKAEEEKKDDEEMK